MSDTHDHSTASPAYADLGPTSLTPSEQQTQKSPDPKVLKICTELGLRYRPLATADQEDHQATVLLLTRDLHGSDPAKLKEAASEWARSERFMPKACDLLAIMARIKGKYDPNCRENLERLAAKYNAADWMRPDLRWTVENGQLKLGPA